MAQPAAGRNKVILITGSTGGIGRATAIAFAKEGGYDLALHYNSASPETRNSLLFAIKNVSNAKFGFYQANMGDYDSVRKLYRDVVNEMGDIDVLFNNAGATMGVSGVQSLADVSMDVMDQTWKINTGSAILLTQLCLPHMESKEWGRVIFCSSVAAFTGGFVGPHYASSKSAQHGFIHWFANNVAKKGITVNGVAPALIAETNMMGNTQDEEVQKRIASREWQILNESYKGFTNTIVRSACWETWETGGNC